MSCGLIHALVFLEPPFPSSDCFSSFEADPQVCHGENQPNDSYDRESKYKGSVSNVKAGCVYDQMAGCEEVFSVYGSFKATITISSTKDFIRSKYISAAKQWVMEWNLAVFTPEFTTQFIIK